MSDKLFDEMVAALRAVKARELPFVMQNNPIMKKVAEVLAKVDAYYGPEYPAQLAPLAVQGYEPCGS